MRGGNCHVSTLCAASQELTLLLHVAHILEVSRGKIKCLLYIQVIINPRTLTPGDFHPTKCVHVIFIELHRSWGTYLQAAH